MTSLSFPKTLFSQSLQRTKRKHSSHGKTRRDGFFNGSFSDVVSSFLPVYLSDQRPWISSNPKVSRSSLFVVDGPLSPLTLCTMTRSRNLYAYQMGQMADSYEHTALNNNLLGLFSSSVCGQVQGGGRDFDFTRTGNQAAYTSGQTITVEAHLNVYHKGHFELSICSEADVNQDCFRNPANKLRFVRDNLYEAPIDAIHPYRAMIPPSSLGTYYSFDMKLPDNMENGNYVLKWMYVTANSCEPEGYDSYPFPSSWGSMT